MRGINLSRCMLVMIVLLLPLHAFGAEEIRFKHESSLYADEKGVGLNQPEGVACSNDRLAVADTGNGRLVLFTLQGGEFKGGTEIRLSQVLYPIRIVRTHRVTFLCWTGSSGRSRASPLTEVSSSTWSFRGCRWRAWSYLPVSALTAMACSICSIFRQQGAGLHR